MVRVGPILAAGALMTLGACDFRPESDRTQPQDPETAGTGVAESDTSPETGTPSETEQADNGQPAADTVTPASTTSKATIDWEAARRDMASAGENNTTFNIQSGESAPPVPVLLPSGPVGTASSPDGPQPQFRPVADGYFAVFPRSDYNIIVNGTNELTRTGGEEDGNTEDMKYAATTTGAIVSFSRYGAHYMVEFECLGSGEEGGDCISEEDAMSVAEDIVISGTQ